MSDLVGVTPTGFVRPTLADMIIGNGQRIVTRFGKAVNLAASAVIGGLSQIFMSEADDVWQLARQVYDAFNPAVATGVSLDILCSYTGTIRKAATFSKATLYVTGDVGTVVTTASTVSNEDSAVNWAVDSDADPMAAPTAWSAAAPIDVLNVRIASGKIYVAIAAGTTGSTAPSSTDPYPAVTIDGTVEWAYLGTDTGYAIIPAAFAIVSGPIQATAFTLSKIGTPLSGWHTVANPQDAIAGQNAELDGALRRRRIVELKGIAAGVVGSIRSEISGLDGVTSVTVFENPTDYVNADSMSPHTIEALVSGSATAADICGAIFRKVGGGIDTMGAHSMIITDSQGIDWTIRYSVPTTVDIYLEYTLFLDSTGTPADAMAIAAAMGLAFGQALQPGYDVDPSSFAGILKPRQEDSPIKGLLGVQVKVSTAPITGMTAAFQLVTISSRAAGAFDSTRITTKVVRKAP